MDDRPQAHRALSPHPPSPPIKEGETKAIATDGGCGLSWDDSLVTSMTPAPSGRCPFEYFHEYDDGELSFMLDATDIPYDWPVQPVTPQ